ncbi:MAG: serine hydrolase domain-containing protein [Candidatus Hermodarchaeota archaeon]
MSHLKVTLLLSLMLIAFFPVCGSIVNSKSSVDYWPTEEWQSTTPEEQNMDSSKLDAMIDYFVKQHYAVDSVLVVRNSYIVREEYFGISEDRIHPIYSCTKSIISALIGIAIQEGYIQNINQKMVDFFPERNISSLNSWKQAITIEHLLSMTSGLSWNEGISYFSSQNSFVQLTASNDWVQFVLDRPMKSEPGTIWNYNSGGSHLLSVILDLTTGNNTLAFAQHHLFNSLGISEIEWSTDPQGFYFGGSRMRLKTRDMAKLGYLYLNNGIWDGEQIVPKEWVISSTEKYIALDDYVEYGYQWWIYPQLDAFLAVGWGGQRIVIIPKYNLVVIFTGNMGESVVSHYKMIADYIIPAIESYNPAFFPIIFSVAALIAVVCLKKKREKTR